VIDVLPLLTINTTDLLTMAINITRPTEIEKKEVDLDGQRKRENRELSRGKRGGEVEGRG